MYRYIMILTLFWLQSVSLFAEGGQPIIEIRADRTMIYPQRMELMGEETLMDVLQMVPDLMIAGYEDVVANYSVRIDNCPMNGDTRLILSQMKAKDIATIQVCDNTGVAKGTIGMGRVLDINMMMPERLKGFAEGQASMGRDAQGIGAVNVLYGSAATDLYANTSYRHHDGNETYLTLHMTNRFDDKNRLLTYFTHQYLDQPAGMSRKVMGRARYFHTFNSMGTELLVVGSYQYASDTQTATELPLVNVELNTPLFNKRLTMMLGAESDFLMTRQKGTSTSWHTFNYDVYLQFAYSLPKWRFTVGNRMIFYRHQLKEKDVIQQHNDTRYNANACIVFVPNASNQLQLGYYHKYFNPTNASIHQLKLAYAYSRQRLTLQTEVSHYVIADDNNLLALGASAYWKYKSFTLAGGLNLYAIKHQSYAAFRLSPMICLPHQWQIAMKVVYFTSHSPKRELTGIPTYGCLSVNKQITAKWHMGIDWHDMFDASNSRKATVNRHAANLKLQYRF